MASEPSRDSTFAGFSFAQAFARNIGWVTAKEQQALRQKRIAIAGLGGVGGSYLLTLTRLGIGAFSVADFDAFELPNLNRQMGATLSSLGRAKCAVLSDMARDINPQVDLRILPQGINRANVSEFLDGVDLYLDGLDFFAFEARRAVFDECARRAIPATTVAPLGMGAALLNFLPGKMTFEDYFGWDGRTEYEMAIRFLVGLGPGVLQRHYLMDRSAVDLARHRAPSTAMACELCAGIAATEALKILLGRGKVIAAPRGVHFDAYRNKLTRTWRPGGNRNPLQRLAIAIAKWQLKRNG